MVEDTLTPAELSKVIDNRLSKDWDIAIVVSGEEGVGKSTIAAHIGLNDKKFSFQKNMIYSPSVEKIEESIKSLPKRSVVIADEAIKILFKLEFWSEASRFMTKFFAVCRQENMCALFCIPNFWDLNKYFREHRCKLWIHCVKRGLAVGFVPDPSPFAQDKWNLKENIKMMDKYLGRNKFRDLLPDKILAACRRSKNFAFIIEFPDLPEDAKTLYLAGKAEHKYDELNLSKMGKRGNTSRVAAGILAKLLIDKYKFSQVRLARITPLTQQRYSEILTYTLPEFFKSNIDMYNRIEEIIGKLEVKPSI